MYVNRHICIDLLMYLHQYTVCQSTYNMSIGHNGVYIDRDTVYRSTYINRVTVCRSTYVDRVTVCRLIYIDRVTVCKSTYIDWVIVCRSTYIDRVTACRSAVVPYCKLSCNFLQYTEWCTFHWKPIKCPHLNIIHVKKPQSELKVNTHTIFDTANIIYF